MRAAYYTKLGSARDVLQIGEIDTPSPGLGEIRVRVHVSGVNPSDWKARLRGRGAGLPFPMIIPGSFQIPVDSFSEPLAVIGWQSQP